MFELILYQPEIPPNTGNIIRVCANTGTHLHLVHPLGFSLEEKSLRRAGLDYHEFVAIQEHQSLGECLASLGARRLFAVSTRGTQNYAEVDYRPGDAFLLGPETRGLPQDVLDGLPGDQVLRIPMRPENRSLNLSNAAAILVYEAWRQNDFAGGA
ncbi:MAG: tRNA (uridine(34)/cytosine(34)/5-carboxymethylaminomethyluridine(34)-2'-O)-methyltransferase TrmL [Gammaproteobacteria bacterium]